LCVTLQSVPRGLRSQHFPAEGEHACRIDDSAPATRPLLLVFGRHTFLNDTILAELPAALINNLSSEIVMSGFGKISCFQVRTYKDVYESEITELSSEDFPRGSGTIA